MSILSVRDISKSYKLRKVVKSISLEIRSGEVVGLLLAVALGRHPRLAQPLQDVDDPLAVGDADGDVDIGSFLDGFTATINVGPACSSPTKFMPT